MLSTTKRHIQTGLRIAVMATLFVGPVGALALTSADTGGGISGAGLVIYVSLQRAG